MLLTGIIGASAAIKGAKIGKSIMDSTKGIKEKTGKAKEENAVMDKYKASHPGEKQNTLIKRHGLRKEFANNNGMLSEKSKKTMNKMGLTEQDLVRPRNDAEIAADNKKAEKEAKAAEKAANKQRREEMSKTAEGRLALFKEDQEAKNKKIEERKEKARLAQEQLDKDRDEMVRKDITGRKSFFTEDLKNSKHGLSPKNFGTGDIEGVAKPTAFVKGFQKYADDKLDDYGMAVLRQKDAAKAKAAESAKAKKDREAVLRAKIERQKQIDSHMATLNQMKAALPKSKNKLADKKKIAAYEAMIKKQFGL